MTSHTLTNTFGIDMLEYMRSRQLTFANHSIGYIAPTVSLAAQQGAAATHYFGLKDENAAHLNVSKADKSILCTDLVFSCSDSTYLNALVANSAGYYPKLNVWLTVSPETVSSATDILLFSDLDITKLHPSHMVSANNYQGKNISGAAQYITLAFVKTATDNMAITPDKFRIDVHVAHKNISIPYVHGRTFPAFEAVSGSFVTPPADPVPEQFVPADDGLTDLGSDAKQFKDAYVAGALKMGDASNADFVSIRGRPPAGQEPGPNGNHDYGAFHVDLTSSEGLDDGRYIYIGNQENGNNGQHIMLGYNAGGTITNWSNAHDNIAMGDDTMKNLTASDNNICIGAQSGASVDGQTGNNIIIGTYANCTGWGSNQIVIGHNTTGTGDNEIAFGPTSVTAIKAQVTSITGYSDERIKTDVKDSSLGLEFISKLRPVTYKKVNPFDYPAELAGDNKGERPADDPKTYDGLIAQEVKQVMDELGAEWSGHSVNSTDGKQGLQYGALVVPLIGAIKELKSQLDELKSRMDTL